jgi:hypothetical protein
LVARRRWRAATIRNLATTWEIATPDQRRELLMTIVAEITAGPEGLVNVVVRPGWLPYVEEVLKSKGPTERKTGLYVSNVETDRLVRDDRGWLRLTG